MKVEYIAQFYKIKGSRCNPEYHMTSDLSAAEIINLCDEFCVVNRLPPINEWTEIRRLDDSVSYAPPVGRWELRIDRYIRDAIHDEIAKLLEKEDGQKEDGQYET